MRKSIALLAVSLLSSACAIVVDDDHFFHPDPPSTTRATFAQPAEDVHLDGEGGAKLEGVYVRCPNATVDVLYFGGDVFSIDAFGADIASAACSAGANLFMIDYRGYGRTSGTPTLPNLKSDALAAFDALRARNEGRPIVVHGFSMGSFVAPYVAQHRPVAGLVLESTAPSVKEWADSQVPGYAKPFVKVKIGPLLSAEDNTRAVGAYCGPLLLVTGDRDRVTPPRFSQKLFDRSCTPAADKRIAIAPGGNHGTAFTIASAQQAYREFLARVAKTGA
ncbi:MAG TPA: alpha/beta fold hydrolase [Thermoanaerobaculia bacterium]|nr:alpha/beta fold hydrolase [Thermoanaerobaculia bacterium]